jgi:hypothetical protein
VPNPWRTAGGRPWLAIGPTAPPCLGWPRRRTCSTTFPPVKYSSPSCCVRLPRLIGSGTEAREVAVRPGRWRSPASRPGQRAMVQARAARPVCGDPSRYPLEIAAPSGWCMTFTSNWRRASWWQRRCVRRSSLLSAGDRPPPSGRASPWWVTRGRGSQSESPSHLIGPGGPQPQAGSRCLRPRATGR